MHNPVGAFFIKNKAFISSANDSWCIERL